METRVQNALDSVASTTREALPVSDPVRGEHGGVDDTAPDVSNGQVKPPDRRAGYCPPLQLNVEVTRGNLE